MGEGRREGEREGGRGKRRGRDGGMEGEGEGEGVPLSTFIHSQSSEYVLQVSGERSYIAGENELLSFKDIRHCIIKSEPIHLSISPRPDPANDVPFKIHVREHIYMNKVVMEPGKPKIQRIYFKFVRSHQHGICMTSLAPTAWIF